MDVNGFFDVSSIFPQVHPRPRMQNQKKPPGLLLDRFLCVSRGSNRGKTMIPHASAVLVLPSLVMNRLPSHGHASASAADAHLSGELSGIRQEVHRRRMNGRMPSDDALPLQKPEAVVIKLVCLLRPLPPVND